MREKLTHFDEKGNAVMVDVSEKEVTSRVAVASGKIRVNAKVMEAVKKGTSLDPYLLKSIFCSPP